jgi:hypothetical protein
MVIKGDVTVTTSTTFFGTILFKELQQNSSNNVAGFGRSMKNMFCFFVQ